jgi:succinate-semialdehyde dehydrogenase/glutarate-semialdehyde dehydrogenase
MPWNFPFWQLFRFAAPALMAGNVGLLKHASNVPGCAVAIEEIFLRAGFPEAAFQTLLIPSDRVERVIDDDRVRAATLTGSEAAGAAVAAAAGRRIKKTVLELGGSDPFVVMPSADLDRAVETAVTARHINNGQSCIAAKRFIVHEDIAGEFTARFVDRTEALVVGDPMDPATDIGPLATEAIRDELADQVERAVEAGAHVLTGGETLDRPGWYYAPTVMADVAADSPVAREETFGPVAAVFVVGSLDEAIERANDTEFGLGASAWTAEPAEQARFAGELEAGCVFINRMVASDPRLPFGGIKKSGYGRELSRLGMHEFLNIKTVGIDEA